MKREETKGDEAMGQPREPLGKELMRSRMRETALDLCAQEHLSTRQIGERLGVSHETVRRWVRAELERLDGETQRSTRQLRALQVVQLDKLENALWTRAMAGDLRAIETELKIMERRSRLLRLDLTNGHLTPVEQVERAMKVLRQEATDEELRAMKDGDVPPRLVPLLPPHLLPAPPVVEVEGDEEEGAGDVEGDWSPVDPAS